MRIEFIKRLGIYQLIDSNNVVIKGSKSKQELIDYREKLKNPKIL